MQTVFEKIIEKLEEKHEQYINAYGIVGGNPSAFTVKECIDTVRKIAEHYNNGWIPCSDQLPEDGMSVLVQDFDEYYEIGICEKRNGVIGITSGDWWTSANNYIAWQPLPQPFHPKGE